MNKPAPTRILVVEDEAIVVRDISLQLARAGYERVAVTPRGEDSIALAGELRPDLVLMDIQLAGEMDGIEAATRIREQHHIPVVFITAFADEAVLQRARQAEPFGYIVKPFEERELQPAIEIALHKHRTEVALQRSEERFRRLFHGVRDAVLIADTETGRIVEANEEACRLFARAPSELIGLEFASLHPPEHRERYRSHFVRHASGADHLLRDAEIVTGDGRVVPVEINAGLVDLGTSSALLGVFRDVSARRAAEQAIRDREAWIDAIFRAAPAGIGVVRERVIIEINEHICELSGYGRHELLGQTTRMLYLSDAEYEEIGREQAAQRTSRRTGVQETRWRRKDGAVIDVLVNFTSIDPGAATSEFTFTAVDITERIRIKSELARRNRTLEGLQRISHTMLDAVRDSDAFMALAAETAATVGTRFAALLLHHAVPKRIHVAGVHGLPGSTTIPRELPAGTLFASRILETGAPILETAPRRIAEAVAPELLLFPPAFYAGAPVTVNGRCTGVLAVLHDELPEHPDLVADQVASVALHLSGLLERREARAAQLRSETELLAIYDHAPVIICLLDEAMQIIRVNQSAARFAGRQVSELLGARAGELIDCLHCVDDSRGCGHGPLCSECPLRLTVLDTLRTGASHAQVEVTKNVSHHGETRQAHLLLSTARIDLDGHRRILVVLEDMTENRRLTEQLMRAQRMESIGTLASGIAHDLNNVLAPIVMCLSMLRETIREPGIREMIETMQLAANRGADIVRQVLTFARGLGGDRVEIQPKHIIQETARIARETFPRSIEVSCDYGRDLQTVVGDPTQIQQVLMNLCVNARDAMSMGGQLAIRADNATQLPDDVLPAPKDRTGRFVRLTVRDTGTGMSHAVKERIFDPFFTTKPTGKGTGLGLAVSLGIVERHGGAIAVESTPGAGSLFSVYLPAAEPGASSRPELPVEEALPRGSGELILIVDDEPGVRSVMTGMLEKTGYKSLAARDGTEALAHLEHAAGGVRLVISDLMMPGMDGLELLRRIRRFPVHLPLIAMTGLGDDDVRSKAKALGADCILAKPFSSVTLLNAMRDLLAR